MQFRCSVFKDILNVSSLHDWSSKQPAVDKAIDMVLVLSCIFDCITIKRDARGAGKGEGGGGGGGVISYTISWWPMPTPIPHRGEYTNHLQVWYTDIPPPPPPLPFQRPSGGHSHIARLAAAGCSHKGRTRMSIYPPVPTLAPPSLQRPAPKVFELQSSPFRRRHLHPWRAIRTSQLDFVTHSGERRPHTTSRRAQTAAIALTPKPLEACAGLE